MKHLFIIMVLLSGCAVTPPEPPEPQGELFPINKPQLSAVEMMETKPVEKPKPKKTKRKVRRGKRT